MVDRGLLTHVPRSCQSFNATFLSPIGRDKEVIGDHAGSLSPKDTVCSGELGGNQFHALRAWLCQGKFGSAGCQSF